MKTKFYSLLFAFLTVALSARAQITVQDPVITDSYLKFVGENATNNYRYTLDTYEWADRGPQFQLTIEPIDPSKSAQFSASDLTDDNYWEPLFRYYTKEIAGKEMTAQNNVKRLYVNNVTLLASQFSDYAELHHIGIQATGNFIIPDGCFSGCTRLETFDSNIQGSTLLGSDIVPVTTEFTVKVYTEQGESVWSGYKQNNSAAFIIDGSSHVDGLEADAGQSAPRYNLSGQRVSANYKGIVVSNGRKVVVK